MMHDDDDVVCFVCLMMIIDGGSGGSSGCSFVRRKVPFSTISSVSGDKVAVCLVNKQRIHSYYLLLYVLFYDVRSLP